MGRIPTFEMVLEQLEADGHFDLADFVKKREYSQNDVISTSALTLEFEKHSLQQAVDKAYEERNRLVALLTKIFPSTRCKTAIEGWSEDWHGCVYVQLPTGQVSWHFHNSQAGMFAHVPYTLTKWDGHTTAEKYQRIEQISVAFPNPHSSLLLADLKAIVETFGGAEEDTEISFKFFQAGIDTDGDKAPAGLYAWEAEYPEEGVTLIRKRDDK